MNRSLLSRYLPVIMWMGVIYVLSAQPQLPGPDDPLLDVVLKKLGHITVYAILMLLLLRAITAGPLRMSHVLIGMAVLLVYACSDEFHQSFVANRHPALTDVLFDATGGVAGAWLYWRAQQLRASHWRSPHWRSPHWRAQQQGERDR